MNVIRKEYESQFKQTERGLIHYSEWLEDKLEEYSQKEKRLDGINCVFINKDDKEISCYIPESKLREVIEDTAYEAITAPECDSSSCAVNNFCECNLVNEGADLSHLTINLPHPPNNQVSELIEKYKGIIKMYKDVEATDYNRGRYDTLNEVLQDLKTGDEWISVQDRKPNVFLREKGLNFSYLLSGGNFKGTLLDLLNEYKQSLSTPQIKEQGEIK